MMFEGETFSRGLEVTRQISLTIPGDTVAQDVILHSTTNVDGVDLYEPQMIQRFPDLRETGIKTRGKAHEAAGCLCGNR